MVKTRPLYLRRFALLACLLLLVCCASMALADSPTGSYPPSTSPSSDVSSWSLIGYIKQGLLDFYNYVASAIITGICTVLTASIQVIPAPPPWAQQALAAIAKFLAFANEWVDVTTAVSCFSFLIVLDFAFWTLKVVARFKFLGFGIG